MQIIDIFIIATKLHVFVEKPSRQAFLSLICKIGNNQNILFFHMKQLTEKSKTNGVKLLPANNNIVIRPVKKYLKWEYKIQDKYFAVNTINLNSDFKLIKQKLINIINNFY